MSLFQRIIEFFRNFFGSLFGGKHREEKQIEKMLGEYRSQLADVKKALDELQGKTDQAADRLRRADTQMKLAAEQAKRQLALGDENGARRCLEEKNAIAKTVPDLQKAYASCKANSEKVAQSYHDLLIQVEKLEQRKENASAQIAAAHAQMTAEKAAGGKESPLGALEEEAAYQKDVADSLENLNDPMADLMKKYSDEPVSDSADDVEKQLAEMERQLQNQGTEH